MDFSFSEEQLEIRGAIKALLTGHVTDDSLKASSSPSFSSK